MGVSRTWNGSEANYLDTQTHGTFYGTSCQSAWIRPASLGLLGTIFGNRFDAGYAFQISAADELQISWQESGVIYYSKMPLTIAGGASQDFLQAGVPLFVAANISGAAPSAPTISFYAGQSPSTVQLLGTNSGSGSFIANNGTQQVLIGANNFGGIFDAFDGRLQRIGLYAINLTLDELKSLAVCGSTPPHTSDPAELRFFYEITGASPEPNLVVLGSSALVVGSLPTAGDLCPAEAFVKTGTGILGFVGSGASAIVPPRSGSQLITCM